MCHSYLHTTRMIPRVAVVDPEALDRMFKDGPVAQGKIKVKESGQSILDVLRLGKEQAGFHGTPRHRHHDGPGRSGYNIAFISLPAYHLVCNGASVAPPQ